MARPRAPQTGLPGRMLLLLPAVLVVMQTACADSAAGPRPSAPPNLIVVLTDDMTVHETPFLPAVTSLAQRGATFSNSFVTTPQCSPARASLLRGQYAHNHRVLINNPPYGGFTVFRSLAGEQSTVATWLKEAGYVTGFVGKYLNHYGGASHSDWTYVPPGWEEWYAVLTGTGRASPAYLDYQLNENGVLVDYSGFEGYATDVYTAKALDFIRRRAADTTSFFLLVAPLAPHGPQISAPRHVGTLAGTAAPRNPSFNEPDVSDKPDFMQRLPLLTGEDIATIDGLWQQRLESLLAVDDMVDSLVNVLDEVGIANNTYIFFTSDNGFHLGEHRLMPGKNTPYDEDLRVPLVVAGPRVAGGQVRDELVLNIDLAPTFADFAGATIPEFVDGRSLTPLLGARFFRAPVLWRRRFLAENWLPRSAPTEIFKVLRSDSVSFIWRPSGVNELYAMTVDPYQLANGFIEADSMLVFDLTQRVSVLTTCSGAACRMAEDAP